MIPNPELTSNTSLLPFLDCHKIQLHFPFRKSRSLSSMRNNLNYFWSQWWQTHTVQRYLYISSKINSTQVWSFSPFPRCLTRHSGCIRDPWEHSKNAWSSGERWQWHVEDDANGFPCGHTDSDGCHPKIWIHWRWWRYGGDILRHE